MNTQKLVWLVLFYVGAPVGIYLTNGRDLRVLSLIIGVLLVLSAAARPLLLPWLYDGRDPQAAQFMDEQRLAHERRRSNWMQLLLASIGTTMMVQHVALPVAASVERLLTGLAVIALLVFFWGR